MVSYLISRRGRAEMAGMAPQLAGDTPEKREIGQLGSLGRDREPGGGERRWWRACWA